MKETLPPSLIRFRQPPFHCTCSQLRPEAALHTYCVSLDRSPVNCLLQLGFMLGGAGLGGFLLMGYSWRFVFQFVSVAAVLCAAVLIFLIPAAAPHSLTSEDGANHADYCITVPRDNRPKVSLTHTAVGQPAHSSGPACTERRGQPAQTYGSAAATSCAGGKTLRRPACYCPGACSLR